MAQAEVMATRRMICFLCDKQIEGDDVTFDLFDGFVLYQRQKPNSTHREIAHNCKTPRYYKLRKKSMQADKLGEAYRRHILRPSKRTRAVIEDLTYEYLLNIAKSSSTMDSIRAAERLFQLFVDPEPEPEALPEQTPKRDIHVVVREHLPMASLRVGEPLAHDRADGRKVVKQDTQRADPAIQHVDPAIQQSFEPNGNIQHVDKENGTVDDLESVERERERERQEYWDLEVAAWENASAAKRPRGLFG